MSGEAFGPLVATWNVEQVIVSVYREWLPTYLAAVERQNGLANKTLPRPPEAESYYGGLDFETEVQYGLPAVIVTVNPTGRPERRSTGYSQAYDIQVGCVIEMPSEEEARMVASLYGAASMLLVQLGGLRGLAERTVMESAPAVEFVDPERRQLARSVIGFTVYVETIILESGPAGETITESPEIPSANPEERPAERPTVATTHLTVLGE